MRGLIEEKLIVCAFKVKQCPVLVLEVASIDTSRCDNGGKPETHELIDMEGT
jgi:hypothetical protein